MPLTVAMNDMHLESRRFGQGGLAQITSDEFPGDKFHRRRHVQQVKTLNAEPMTMAFGQTSRANTRGIPRH